MTDVVDRLERLAAHAPARAVEPDRLWSRGQRRQRARWVGVAACLVLLAVLGGVAVPAGVQRTQGVVTVAPDGAMVLPDVIREPGKWEPAFRGAPGRLVAAGVGTRGGWRGSRPALWGVSATTGESRFLDVPDVAAGTGTPAALSADGRRLAYWFTDDVEALPADLGPDDSMPVRPAGVAVVELATGDIERWDTESAYGLAADGLAWAGDVLWWTGGPVEPVGEVGTRSRVLAHTWDVATGERSHAERNTPGSDLPLGTARSTADGFLANGLRTLYLTQGDRLSRSVSLTRRIRNAAALSPDGTQVAAVLDPDPSSGASMEELDALVVGDLATGPMDMARVGDAKAADVYGWRSSHEVVVVTHAGTATERLHAAAVVDVRTAEMTRLLKFDGAIPTFAADAWSADVIEAPDAPWAPDPRVVGMVVLIVGAFVVSLARSLRRRRGHA